MDQDVVVVGASFAGLACATALAQRGQRVTVVERKADPGEKLHTTGILVRDVIDRVPLLDGLPPEFMRRIDGVRLYAPNLRHVDLAAPDYYFVATDTPAVLRWLAARSVAAGARLQLACVYRDALEVRAGFDLGGIGTARVLVGADGPRSAVARSLGLGRNHQFLSGIEYEYGGAPIPAADQLHCFIDRHCMPGYIGWVLQGVGVTQVGLARRYPVRSAGGSHAAMDRFLHKIAPLFDFRMQEPLAIRAGLIPCGGVVHPVARSRALLIGDAAGMVSPVTAGGIHLALQHGLGAGHVIADFLAGRGKDPGQWAQHNYPRFRLKRVLRFLFDHFQTDWAFNQLLSTRLLREIACQMYFHARAAPGANIRRSMHRP